MFVYHSNIEIVKTITLSYLIPFRSPQPSFLTNALITAPSCQMELPSYSFSLKESPHGSIHFLDFKSSVILWGSSRPLEKLNDNPWGVFCKNEEYDGQLWFQNVDGIILRSVATANISCLGLQDKIVSKQTKTNRNGSMLFVWWLVFEWISNKNFE